MSNDSINGNSSVSFVDLPENYEYNNTSNIYAFIAMKNPFRYRSYYYDFETGLYYLNSRYYDPQIGRFVNADSLNNLEKNTSNGLNLYAYCINNPVNLMDDTGTSWKSFWRSVGNFFKRSWDVIVGTIISVGLVIGGVALVVFTGGAAYHFGAAMIGAGVGGFIGGLQSKLNGGSYWGGYLGGAISGGLTGLGVSFGPVASLIWGTVGNYAGTITTDFINGEVIDGNYALHLLGESVLSGLVSMGAWGFSNFTGLLNIPGFRDIFAGITVWAEFAFNDLYNRLKTFVSDICNLLRQRIFNFS